MIYFSQLTLTLYSKENLLILGYFRTKVFPLFILKPLCLKAHIYKASLSYLEIENQLRVIPS
jgi:hypothetical protein